MATKTLKCPFCSKQAPVSRKGHFHYHFNGGGVRCIGTGANAAQMSDHARYLDELAARKVRRKALKGHHSFGSLIVRPIPLRR